MNKCYLLIVCGLLNAALLGGCGTADRPSNVEVPPLTVPEPTAAAPRPASAVPALEQGIETEVAAPSDNETGILTVEHEDIEVVSAGKAYLSYLSAPKGGGTYPGIILIHSFNGLEEGYRTMTDQFAAAGYVVLAVGWQTFERSPDDTTIQELLMESTAYLRSRDDVDGENIGLTGFCAGGRYTMLFLPQIKDFKAGVAWYGFPYSGDTQPANLIADLTSPLFIIHGTADSPSPIEGIYRYVSALEEAGKDFEFEVYEGEPHGFMLTGGQLRADPVAQDAFAKMVSFFDLQLK
jgi:carboxymethylenebutenolidase